MLEQKIEALTAAVVALIAQMSSQSGTVVATASAPSFGAASATTTLANGMPGGPFGNQAPAATPSFAAPPAQTGAPFNDLKGCVDYATAAYGVIVAKDPNRSEVITQLIMHLCGSPSINDLPVAAYPTFYAELEKQKAI